MTVLSSVGSDENYEGYIYFAEANTQFKFTPGPSWDADWGDNGADGTLEAGGANIEYAEAGYYNASGLDALFCAVAEPMQLTEDKIYCGK